MRVPTTQEREDHCLILEQVNVKVLLRSWRDLSCATTSFHGYFCLNLGPRILSYLFPGVREYERNLGLRLVWSLLRLYSSEKNGNESKGTHPLCDPSSTTGYSM